MYGSGDGPLGRGAMQQLVAEMTGPLALSDRAARMLARVREARRELLQANGREPSVTELCAATQLVVGATRTRLAHLRDALGPKADRVAMTDVSALYLRPARTIAAYHTHWSSTFAAHRP